jgi:hypothetical protein
MTRFAVGAVLFALLGVGSPARADAFASLTVTPAGEQTFDLATGITTLPQGGEIRDAERGVRMVSGFIRYQAGVFLETAEVEATGDFGLLKAERLHFDLARGEVQAWGPLELTSGDLTLHAGELLLDLAGGVARLGGGVRSSLPDFEAASLVMTLDGTSALLVAPYRYESEGLALSQERPGDLLQLTRNAQAEGRLAFSPSTRIRDDVLASLTPYLNQ